MRELFTKEVKKSREKRDESIIAGLNANATNQRCMPED
jgi:hypothetical protein